MRRKFGRMQKVRLSSVDWSYEPVLRAEGFLDHLRGLRGAPGRAVLLETSSVHGIGIGGPFHAVALSRDLEVTAARVVRPWRVATFRRTKYVMELPLEIEPPRVGTVLELSHV